jgi:hypothetical protein
MRAVLYIFFCVVFLHALHYKQIYCYIVCIYVDVNS